MNSDPASVAAIGDALSDEYVTKTIGQSVGKLIDQVAVQRGDAKPLPFVLLIYDREGKVHRVSNLEDSDIMGVLAPVLEQLVAEHIETVGKPAPKAKLDS